MVRFDRPMIEVGGMMGEIILGPIRLMVARAQNHARFVLRGVHPFGAARLNEKSNGTDAVATPCDSGPAETSRKYSSAAQDVAFRSGHADDHILPCPAREFLFPQDPRRGITLATSAPMTQTPAR